MVAVHSSESTKIVTKLIPRLVFDCKTPIDNMKTDCSTSKTLNKRVDILISKSQNASTNFESDLLTILEAKQESARILDIYDLNGDVKEEIFKLVEENIALYETNSSSLNYGTVRERDWFNALIQGKWKAQKLNLPFFGVTNTNEVRFYHTETLKPILIKRNVAVVNDEGAVENRIIEEQVNFFPVFNILKDIRSQITRTNTVCDFTTLPYEEKQKKSSMTEQEFINFITRIHNDFYGRQLEGSKDVLGDIILTFIFFKYLEERIILLNKVDKYREDGIKVWTDWGKFEETDEDHQKGRKIYNVLRTELNNLEQDEQADKDENGEYLEGYEKEYREFHDILVPIDKIQTNKKSYEFILAIYDGLNGKATDRPLYLHECDFDIYGAIYEKFKNKDQKRELGQYYTKRHISQVIATLTLKPYVDAMKKEIQTKKEELERTGNQIRYNYLEEIIFMHYSNLKIIDPSCGTGGLLTECYSYLSTEYRTILNNRSERIDTLLRSQIFTGIDKEPECVEKTKLNMFFAGDGHTDIHHGSSLEPLNNQNTIFSSKCEENDWNVVISNPPYGQGQEYTFIRQYINGLRYGGRVSLIIPNGVLENPSKFYTEFREFILKNVKIEAIVSIPKFAFAPYAKQKTYMLIGYKRNKETIAELTSESVMTDDGIEKRQLKDLQEKIWFYIMDYDGFNLGDDRWETNLVSYDDEGKPYFLHNDAPELLDKYLIGENGNGLIEKKNQIHIDGSLFGRKINKDDDDVVLLKSKYLQLNVDITEENFWNLLAEHYMRPYESDFITIEEVDNKITSIEEELGKILD
ncbi:HsdM family class I SAM-dependent methyltransferase [Paenibacillus vulneris]|uniref:HsdM family class I SAM-dependent methyltransferase n=1 Tax=Paenibacillus vulneris TaxID=1133364 RepID=UPI0031EA56E5